jgi:hypothetical protein
LAATGRAVRLGKYGANSMRLVQRFERRNGELRRAGETQLQDRKIRAQGA